MRRLRGIGFRIVPQGRRAQRPAGPTPAGPWVVHGPGRLAGKALQSLLDADESAADRGSR